MARYWAGYQWRDHHDSVPETHEDLLDAPPLRSIPMPMETEIVCETCSATHVGDHSEDECIANLLKPCVAEDESTDDQYVGAEDVR